MAENGNGNGRKIDWLRWVNSVLLIMVGALLALYIKSNDERITRLEELVVKQERVVRLEEEVKRIAWLQSSSGADIRFLESEVARLRKYHEK